MPRHGEARIEVSPEITGVLSGYAYAWIIRTKHGAALVDTGSDPDGRALLTELSREGVAPGDVHTILLTHGHNDHWVAASHFPRARVLVGHGDAAIVRGERQYMPRWIQAVAAPHAPAPTSLSEIEPGDLDVDGVQIRALPLPGHTEGSVGYLLGDVLFSGDSLMNVHDRLGPGPSFFSEDPDQNRASNRTLSGLPFHRVADGHSGLTQLGESPAL
jgi:glyoxylase-like metal-dependent hydrolase (beta-lactamase superfamily II)